jgi:hypothetical protein
LCRNDGESDRSDDGDVQTRFHRGQSFAPPAYVVFGAYGNDALDHRGDDARPATSQSGERPSFLSELELPPLSAVQRDRVAALSQRASPLVREQPADSLVV